jgi:Ca2+-binding EF-hand superfamily protein
MKTFIKVVQNFSNYTMKEYYRLFQAADVYDRGFLTYKDFLYILAACDQQITHTGSFKI